MDYLPSNVSYRSPRCITGSRGDAIDPFCRFELRRTDSDGVCDSFGVAVESGDGVNSCAQSKHKSGVAGFKDKVSASKQDLSRS